MSDYTPDLAAMREAYRFHARTVDNARYERAGRTPMTGEELDAEFDRFVKCLVAKEARAWDEGYQAGYQHVDPMTDSEFPPSNPHREEDE